MKDIPTTQGARSHQILHTPSQVAMTRRWKTSPTTQGARSHQILHTPSQAAMTRRWKTSLQPKEPDHIKYSTHHLKQPWPEDERHPLQPMEPDHNKYSTHHLKRSHDQKMKDIPYNPWSQITSNTPHTISSSHDQKMKDIPTTHGARSHQILHTPSQAAMTRRWKTSLQSKEPDHIKYSTHHLRQPWPEDERHPYNPRSQITSNTPHTISSGYDQKMKDIPPRSQITTNTPLKVWIKSRTNVTKVCIFYEIMMGPIQPTK